MMATIFNKTFTICRFFLFLNYIGNEYKCTSHPLEVADRRRDLNVRSNENNYSAQV